MIEPYKRINYAEDWTHYFQCGCEVVFLGSCFHRSSRMTCCLVHGSFTQLSARTEMVQEAKRAHKMAEMMQPPI